MKRRIAIFFVLLANIILLAHAAIPHHHFPYTAIFIAQDVDVEHVHDHDHDPSAFNFNHHHHNDKDDYDHCLLNKVISITKNNAKSAVNSDIDFDFGYNFEDFQAIVPDFSFDWDIPIITINLKPHLFSSSYISYSASVLGLRAPPVA